MQVRKLLAILLAAAAAWAAEKKPVTIEAVTGRPARREAGGTPIWAPDGKRFAFTQRNRLMLYDVRAKSEKELLAFDVLEKAAIAPAEPDAFGWQNRRVSESSAQWSPNGNEMLIEAKGDLFLFHLDSGKWDQLTNTPVAERDPKLSPDGKRVAFRREHDLYTLDIASKAVTRLTANGSATLLNGELDWVYPEELDLGTAFWWSPDSTHIAYMQFDIAREFVYPQVDLTKLRARFEPERYPQAGTPNADVSIGVVAATGGDTRWMDLGSPRDKLFARVYWTPDSKHLFVERLNRVQNELFLDEADALFGNARTVVKESDRYWIKVSDQFRFLANGRQFIWSSERDGFRHLYLYGIDGREQGRITQGNWEVTALAGVDEPQRTVYYVSSETSPLERQLYSVRLDGSARRKISNGEGTHDISIAPTADYYLDTFSNVTSPPRRTIHTIDGAEWAVYREADRKPQEEYEILPQQLLTFKTKDGTLLYARLIKPAHFDPKQKYPAIVMVYGGPDIQSVRNTWEGLNWDQVLAHKGFVIWQVDNRGSAGRGRAFEAPVYRRFGKIELSDQLAGVEYLLAQGFVDPARVGIYGWSYGGYMTLYSLLNAPDVFRVGIAGAPVTDWHNYDTIYTERYLGLPSENEEGYRLGSAITYADKLQGRLLMLHNIEDDNVLFQNSLQMAQAFEKAGKDFYMVTYPQKSHGVGGPFRKQLMEETTAFFEKNLNQGR